MGNLGPEEIDPHNVHLCHHRWSTTQFAFHPFHHLCVGRLCPFGHNHREGHLHQHGFVIPDFISSTSEFLITTIPADPSLPVQYSRCGTITSSVGKLWVLPYLIIISYQLCACYRPFCTVLGTHVMHKSNSNLHAHQDFPATSFYPALRPVIALICASD